MSHAIYQTPAWVLKTRNREEANKLIWLYTRDFGLVYTTAQSIRVAGAKMKSHIHHLSFVDTDIVRGKDIWRLVGAHELHSGMSLVGTPWYAFFERIAQVLIRLCVDQEPHPDLWELLLELRTGVDSYHVNDLELFEIFIMTRILSLLGYYDLPEALDSENTLMTPDIRAYTSKNKRALIAGINEAFVASQL